MKKYLSSGVLLFLFAPKFSDFLAENAPIQLPCSSLEQNFYYGKMAEWPKARPC